MINLSDFNPNSTMDIKYPLITNKTIRLLENDYLIILTKNIG